MESGGFAVRYDLLAMAAVALATSGAASAQQRFFMRSHVKTSDVGTTSAPAAPVAKCEALKQKFFPTGAGVIYLVKKQTAADAQAVCEASSKTRGAGICGWDTVYDGGQVYWWPAGSKINTRSETGLYAATCS